MARRLSHPRQHSARRLLRSARKRGVPLFFATGLVIGATVALLTDSPLLPTMLGIAVVGTLFGWLRTGWRPSGWRWPGRR